jgi:uncharacterized membrane protein YczE
MTGMPAALGKESPARTTPRPPRAIRGRVTAGRLALRLLSLYAGLVLFGGSIGLQVRARLGLGSWDVLNQGLARQTGLPMGWIVIGTGAVVLLLWIPLRQRPGFGTASNVIVVGLALDAALGVLPHPRGLILRAASLLAGILLNGFATGLYIGAGMGPGPRDGLMTGLARKGMPIRRARTMIELTVVAAGWLLGGNVGVGTVLYAATIGPLAQFFIPRLTVGASLSPAPAAERRPPSRAKRARSRRIFPPGRGR